MNEPRPHTPLAHRHGEGIERQLLIRLAAHRPTDRPPRIQIQQDRHIEPPGPRGNHGEIPHPDAIEGRGHKALLEQIGRRWGELMVFNDDTEATDASGFEPRELPEPCDPMAATAESARLSNPPELDCAILFTCC